MFQIISIRCPCCGSECNELGYFVQIENKESYATFYICDECKKRESSLTRDELLKIGFASGFQEAC